MIKIHNHEVAYRLMLNQTGTFEQYEYLTVERPSRTKSTARRARQYLKAGNYAAALSLADPIAYNVGLNDFKR